MSLDLDAQDRAVGEGNFQRTVGRLGMTRRNFMRGLVAAGIAAPITAAAYYQYSNSDFRSRPVKAGVIGVGDEGGVLIGEHNPNYVQVVAVSDMRPSNTAPTSAFPRGRIFDGEPRGPRRGLVAHYGPNAVCDIPVYQNYRDLLARTDIEMVIVALPLHLHAKVSIEAMRAGKHVLCEKLMAWNIGQCKEMIRVANETQKLLAIGHQRHYSMLYTHAVEVLNSGVLGDVKHIRAWWHRNNVRPSLEANGRPKTERLADGTTIPVYRDSWRKSISPEDTRALGNVNLAQYGFRTLEELIRWRLYMETGGGLMAELGSHQLDAASIFLARGGPPVHPITVNASGGKHFYQDDREVEDHVYCTYEFPGPRYDANLGHLDARGNPNYNDIVTVTYSSINTNDFEGYGECVMGSNGTLIVEKEQKALLYGGRARDRDTSIRRTEVTVNTTAGGPALDMAPGSEGPNIDRAAAERGQNAVGHAPPSRGYREEMEHFAYCIRMRDEGMERDRANLQPRCTGPKALGDAVMALTANRAMRAQERIVFDPKWFDAADPTVPPWDNNPAPRDLSAMDRG